MLSSVRRLVLGTAGGCAALIVWEFAAIYFSSVLVPRVPSIVAELPKIVLDSSLYGNLWASVQVVVLGYIASVASALPIALMCSRLKWTAHAVVPVHEFVRYIPVPAFVPLLAAIFGIGDVTKVALIFVGTYFQLLFLFMGDFFSVPSRYEESAKTLGIMSMDLLRCVTIPAALPSLINSARISFAWAWSYLLVAEVVNSNKGIGYLVLQSYRVLDMDRLVGLLIVIGVFGVLADAAFRALSRRLCPWLNDAEVPNRA